MQYPRRHQFSLSSASRVALHQISGKKYFEPFFISKTYAQFRTLANDLGEIVEPFLASSQPLPDHVKRLVQACQLCCHLTESQPTEYLGKVSYKYVKGLAKQRQSIVDEVLQILLERFPSNVDHELSKQVAICIEVFFLTDHCEAIEKPSAATGATTTTTTSEAAYTKTPSSKTKLTDGRLATATSNTKFQPPKISFDLGSVTKGIAKVGTGLGNGLNSVTSGVETVVKKINFTGAFCLPEHDLAGNSSTPMRTRKEGAGRVKESKLTPMTTKTRQSMAPAELAKFVDESMLMEENHEDDLATPRASPRRESVFAKKSAKQQDTIISRVQQFVLEMKQHIVIAVVVLAVYMQLRRTVMSAMFSIKVDTALAAAIASFYVGLQYGNKPVEVVAARRPTMAREFMKRTSIISPLNRPAALLEQLDEEDEEETPIQLLESPLPMFPEGAKIGSHNNCWSVPEHLDFAVRGPNYLSDSKKVKSAEFLFPTRGIDLFLTDTCPENVGSFPCVFGGNLREVPTFIINFRLPWGVLVFYFEIPDMYLPFVRACYEPDFDKSTLPDMESMTPGQRTACRFLMNDLDHKNKTLKIVPVVVDGPWIVKSVVGGKPALIGTKLPVNYVYRPAVGDDAMYLEADLDIAASSAARGILSVTRSYTEILTIDLGFVIQGNTEDELPEQMLVGCRIHGVNPLTAPQLPLQVSDLLVDDGDNESPSVAFKDASMMSLT